MDFIKYILIILGLIFAGIILFSLVGLVYSVVFYLAVIGVLGIAGYGAYKFLKKTDAPKLASKDPVAAIRDENERAIRELEEYKRKYLK